VKRLFAICLVFAQVLMAWAPCHAAIQARAAILVNRSTGKILFERNADRSIPPASLTKIMTMFLALDAAKSKKIGLNQKTRVSAHAAKTGGAAMRLAAGEHVPVVRLLAGTAVASGNDAATALAELVGGSEQKFVAQMNAKARSLGMKNTQFKNPTGLPAAGHKSTARDMMLLCRAYLKAHPEAKRFHSMKFFMHKGYVVRNTNPLLGSVHGVDGLKTGWTIASGYNLIITAKRGKTRLLAIVLGCSSRQSRDATALLLLNAGFKYPGNARQVRKMAGR